MFARHSIALGIVMLAVAGPARAERSVADETGLNKLSGYCSPNVVGTADCKAKSLGFSITLGSQTFDSFVVHSNGVFALGGPIDYADKSAALSSFDPPVFSPLLNNYVKMVAITSMGPLVSDDGAFVADYALTANSVTVRWYPCENTAICGPKSSPPSAFPRTGPMAYTEDTKRIQQQDWAFLTLTKLEEGFSVSYDYSPHWAYIGGKLIQTTQSVRYGFDLPTASFEADGPSISRTFLFDRTGALVAVPEPATWLAMVLGFGLMGAALRRTRAGRRVAALA